MTTTASAIYCTRCGAEIGSNFMYYIKGRPFCAFCYSEMLPVSKESSAIE